MQVGRKHTQTMPMGRHWGHGGPDFTEWVIALHHIRGLEAVPSPNHIELVVNHSDSKLQSSPIHDANLNPRVCSEVIFLYCS